jgi:hypothetical protein
MFQVVWINSINRIYCFLPLFSDGHGFRFERIVTPTGDVAPPHIVASVNGVSGRLKQLKGKKVQVK